MQAFVCCCKAHIYIRKQSFWIISILVGDWPLFSIWSAFLAATFIKMWLKSASQTLSHYLKKINRPHWTSKRVPCNINEKRHGWRWLVAGKSLGLRCRDGFLSHRANELTPQICMKVLGQPEEIKHSLDGKSFYWLMTSAAHTTQQRLNSRCYWEDEQGSWRKITNAAQFGQRHSSLETSIKWSIKCLNLHNYLKLCLKSVIL